MSILSTNISTDFIEDALKDPRYSGTFSHQILEDFPVLKAKDEMVIPNHFKIISERCLSGCDCHKLVLPNNYCLLDAYAFESRYNLKEVVGYGNYIPSRSGFQFLNCTSLEKVFLAWVNDYLPQSMFAGCTGLRGIYLGGNIERISSGSLDEVPKDCEIHIMTTRNAMYIGAQPYKYKHTIDVYVPYPDEFMVEYASKLDKNNIILRPHHPDEYPINEYNKPRSNRIILVESARYPGIRCASHN